MSGGVDSSVAAFLLQKEGYEVTACFMKNWSEKNDGETGVCQWKKDRLDALKIASQLNIKFLVFDFEKEYKEKIFNYMLREYKNARTPNPDVMCNKEIKFGIFLKKAKKLGMDFIATGHYARIKVVKTNEKKIYKLLKGIDENKDQSYFLSTLNQKQLSKSFFPVGNFTKPQIREIAEKNGLITFNKKDSQGLCFVGKVDMKTFLQKKIKPKYGKIIDVKGRVIGEHEGVFYYTIGQRKGIGIGGGKPYYVVERDLKNNILVVTNDKKDERLYTKEIKVNSIHWINNDVVKNNRQRRTKEKNIQCMAKIRYRQDDQLVSVYLLSGKKAKCVFKEKQWAVSPGQSIVFYKKDECLGSSIIEE